MKLDASEYRAIILNLQANTKQAHRLRQIACEDSFAARASSEVLDLERDFQWNVTPWPSKITRR